MSFQNNKKYPVRPMNVYIDMRKAGQSIKKYVQQSGYSIYDIMEITGVTSEQAIYKWYSGKTLPSIDKQLVLCALFGVSIPELLDVEEVSYIC